MNRRDFVKRNEDQSVPRVAVKARKTLKEKNEYKEWCLINHPVKTDLKLRSAHVETCSSQF